MILVSTYTVFVLRRQIGQAAPRVGAAPAGDKQVHRTRLLQWLARWLSVNPVTGAFVLLAASIMFAYPLPPKQLPFGISSYVLHSGNLVARVQVTPNRLGINAVTIQLQEPSGRALQGARVMLVTDMQEMDMGIQRIRLRPSGRGAYQGRADLGMGGGTWHFRFLISHASRKTTFILDDLVGA